ncbi:DUF6610 family protein [Haladaptatus pallidirubidus]|uniref:DUF6610 family protein n=1 Tax=Haladaptatus pallidirubidus TaxID=1008152 RepID=UPI0031F05F4A
MTAEYVAFIHHVPCATDALYIGLRSGVQADCTYHQQQFTALDLPIRMLDTDFRYQDYDGS